MLFTFRARVAAYDNRHRKGFFFSRLALKFISIALLDRKNAYKLKMFSYFLSVLTILRYCLCSVFFFPYKTELNFFPPFCIFVFIYQILVNKLYQVKLTLFPKTDQYNHIITSLPLNTRSVLYSPSISNEVKEQSRHRWTKIVA